MSRTLCCALPVLLAGCVGSGIREARTALWVSVRTVDGLDARVHRWYSDKSRATLDAVEREGGDLVEYERRMVRAEEAVDEWIDLHDRFRARQRDAVTALEIWERTERAGRASDFVAEVTALAAILAEWVRGALGGAAP